VLSLGYVQTNSELLVQKLMGIAVQPQVQPKLPKLSPKIPAPFEPEQAHHTLRWSWLFSNFLLQ
jgi:hypothetical protein